MFLDQNELDDQQGESGALSGSLGAEKLEGDEPSSRSKNTKREKTLLLVLLVVVVLVLGYVLFGLGLSKGSAARSDQVPTSSGPSVSKVTTSTTQVANTYNVTKNPFAPVGSPGVNVNSSPAQAPTAVTTTSSAAG